MWCRVLPVMLGVSACATAAQAPRWIPPAPAAAPTTQFVRAPFDSVWTAAVRYFADTRIPIATIDKASGIIASRDFALGQELFQKWADCGTLAGMPYTQLSNVGDLRGLADFNVFVQAAGDSTSVRVNSGIRGIWYGRQPYAVPSRDPCRANGTFATEFVAYIRARAGGA